MKKIVFALVFILSLLCLAVRCTKSYDSRLDTIEGKLGTLATSEEQVTNIRKSIAGLVEIDKTIDNEVRNLEGVSKDLEKLITTLRQRVENFPQATYDTRINELEQRMNAMNSSIVGMRNTDNNIKSQIAKLETTLNTYATRSWANNTFVTLEMQRETSDLILKLTNDKDKILIDIEAAEEKISRYNLDTNIHRAIEEGDRALEREINKLGPKLDTIRVNLGELLDEKIAENDEEVRTWVCDTLDAYWTIGKVDERLAQVKDSLCNIILSPNEAAHKTEIDRLNVRLDSLYSAFDACMIRVKEEYTQAIEDAVSDKIGPRIDDNKTGIAEVNGAIRDLREDADSLMSEVQSLSDDVEALKKRIQSLEFIPDYQGGMAVASASGEVVLKYLVMPAELADSVTVSTAKIIAIAVTPLTKASIPMEITPGNVSADNGVVTVTANIKSALDAASALDKKVSVCLKVETGYTSIVSGYTDIVVKNN